MPSNSKPSFTWKTIDRDTAAAILSADNATATRRVNYAAVNRLITDMKNGKWNPLNIDPIIILGNHRILNGFNRLQAIRISGIATDLLFMNTGSSAFTDELYKSIDSGSMRPVSRRLQGGTRYPLLMPPIAKLACSIEDHGTPLATALKSTAKISHTEATEKAQACEDSFARYIVDGGKMAKETMDKGSAAYAAFLYLAYTFGDPAIADQFVMDFTANTGGNKSVAKCKNYLVRRYKQIDKLGRPKKAWIVGTLLQCYNAYAQGNQVTGNYGKQVTAIAEFDKSIAAWHQAR